MVGHRWAFFTIAVVLGCAGRAAVPTSTTAAPAATVSEPTVAPAVEPRLIATVDVATGLTVSIHAGQVTDDLPCWTFVVRRSAWWASAPAPMAGITALLDIDGEPTLLPRALIGFGISPSARGAHLVEDGMVVYLSWAQRDALADVGVEPPRAMTEPRLTDRLEPDDGVDVTLIRWMLSLSPEERLAVLQGFVDSVIACSCANGTLIADGRLTRVDK